MKKYWKLFGTLGILALTACGNSNEPLFYVPQTSLFTSSSEVPALRAGGGTSTGGSGGSGGYVYARSYGAVKVLKGGTVDASFTVPAYAPVFGGNHAVVSGGTTTVLVDDPNDGNPHLFTKNGDANLYLGNGDGDASNDETVTGLTVDAGATLVLVDQGYWGGYGTLWLSDDLVVNGTITSDASSLYIEANVIYVESGGTISSSATTLDTDAGEIYLGYGNNVTKAIINRGTIESKGLGSGIGGYLYFEADDLVVNMGTIDASGGSSDTGNGGSGGELDVFVDYGDFYSSGIVRMNGGKGALYGGDTEAYAGNFIDGWGYSVYIETAYSDNTRGRNGDIIISGTWEANGGDSTGEYGGHGGQFYLQTNALGAVTINAGMSVRGGNSEAANYSGGNTYGIDIYSYNNRTDPATPGKIRIAGTYDLRGGNGDEVGGNGGYLGVYSDGYNTFNIGSDVELVGFAAIDLNGGEGNSGGSASSNAFQLYTYAAGATPAGPITNEARIEARGGKATVTGNTGGSGGYVEMLTGEPSDPATVIINTGDIDISGGTGDNGGAAYMGGFGDALHLQAVHVTNSGALTANGGAGATAGGSGGNITLNSTDSGTTPTTNTGDLSAAGGTGTTGGTAGTITIDGGGPI